MACRAGVPDRVVLRRLAWVWAWRVLVSALFSIRTPFLGGGFVCCFLFGVLDEIETKGEEEEEEEKKRGNFCKC